MNASALLDFLYPRVCAGCASTPDTTHRHLCWDCLAELEYVGPPYCSLCGDPVEGRIDDAFVCYTCAEGPIHFDMARSAARYRGVLQDVMQQFKYGRCLWLASDLGAVLESCFHAHYDAGAVDSVICVPLFHARQRQRGYNQSLLLAIEVARRIGRPLLRRALARVRPTPTQTHLTAPQRATNVRGAFKVRRPKRFEDARLLLVDDVMTTGATVNECARVLKRAGAKRVSVLTVARG